MTMKMMSSSTARLLLTIVLLLLVGGTVVPTASAFPVNVIRRGADGRLLYHVTKPNKNAATTTTHEVVRGRGPLKPSLPPRPERRVDGRRGGAVMAPPPLKMLVVGEAVLAAVFAAGAAVGSGLANLFADDDDHHRKEEDDGAVSEGERERREEEKEELVVDEGGGSVSSNADVDVAMRNGEEEDRAGRNAITLSSSVTTDVDVDVDVDNDAEDAVVEVEAGSGAEAAESSSSSSSDDVDVHLKGVEEASELLGGDIMHRILSEERAALAPPPEAETANVEPTTPRMMTTATTATTTMDPPNTISSTVVDIDTGGGGVSVSGDDDSPSSSYVDPSLSDLCYLSSSSDSCPDVGPGLSGDPFGNGSSSGGGGSSGGSSRGSGATSGWGGDTRNGHHVNGAGDGGRREGRGHLFANEPDLISPVVPSSSAPSSNFGIRHGEVNGASTAPDGGAAAKNGSIARPHHRTTVRKVNGSATTHDDHHGEEEEANDGCSKSETPPSHTDRVVPRNGAKADAAEDAAADLSKEARPATARTGGRVSASSASGDGKVAPSSTSATEVTTAIDAAAENGAEDRVGLSDDGGDPVVVGGGVHDDENLSAAGDGGMSKEDHPSSTTAAANNVEVKMKKKPSDFGAASGAGGGEERSGRSPVVAPSSKEAKKEKVTSAATTTTEEEEEEEVASAAVGVEGGGLRQPGVVDDSSSSKEEEVESTATIVTKEKVSTPTGEVEVVGGAEEDTSSVTMEDRVVPSSATTAKTGASTAPGEGGAVVHATRVASSVEEKERASAAVKVEEEKVPSVGANTKGSAAPREGGAVHSTNVTSSAGAGAKEDASLGAEVRECADESTEKFSSGVVVGEAPTAAARGEGLVVESKKDAPMAEADKRVTTVAAKEGEVGTSNAVEEEVAVAAAETDVVGSRSSTASRWNSTVTVEEDGVGAAAKRSPSMMGKKASFSKKEKKKMPDASVGSEKMQASEEGPIVDVGGNKFTAAGRKDRVLGTSKDLASVTNGEKMADAAEVDVVDFGKKDLSTTGKERLSSTDDEEEDVVELMQDQLGPSKKEVSPAAEKEENIASKADASASIEEGTSATTARMDAGPSAVAPSANVEDVASVAVEGQDAKGRKRALSAKTKEDVSTAGKKGEDPSSRAGPTASTSAKVKPGTSKEDESDSVKGRVSAPAKGKELAADDSREEEAGAADEDLSAMSDGAKSKKTSPPTTIEQPSASKEDPSAKANDESATRKLVVSTDDLLATIGGKVAAAAREEETRSSKEGTIATSKEQASAAHREDEVVAPMVAPFDVPKQQLSDDTKKEEVRAYKEEPLAAIEEIETAGNEEATLKEFYAAKSSKDTSTRAEKKEVVDFLKDDPSPSTREPVAAMENEETNEARLAGTEIGPAATIKNEEFDDSKEAQSATTKEEVAMSEEEIEAIKAEIEDLKGTLKSKRLEASRLEHEAHDFSKAGYLRKRGETNDARKRMGVASANDKYLARTLVVREFLPVFDYLDDLVDSPLARSDFAEQYAVPALLFGLKAKLAELDVTEYGRSNNEGEIVGKKVDVRRFAIVGEEFSNDVPNGSVLRVVRSGMEIQGNVVRLAECVVSRGAENPPFVAPVTPPVAPRVTKPTSMRTRLSASSANTEPVSLFEQRMRSWHGQDFGNTSLDDPGSGAKPDASASDLGGSSDSGLGPSSKQSLHIWSGPSGSSGSGSGLGGSSDSILSGSASSSKPSDQPLSGGSRWGLLSSSAMSSPSSSPPKSPVSFPSVDSGSSETTPGSSGPLASGTSDSDSYSESPLHSWSGNSGRSGLGSGLGGSSDSVSSGKTSKSTSPRTSLSEDSGVSWAKVGLDGSSHSLLSGSGTQANPSLFSSVGRSGSGGSRAAFGSSSGSMSPGNDSDSDVSIRSFSGYSGSNGPSSVSIMGSSAVPSSSSPCSKTPGHSSPIHSGSRRSSRGPWKTSAPGQSDSGSHPVPSRQSGPHKGVPTSAPPVTTPVVSPATKPSTFVTPSYANPHSTEHKSTFDLRMRRWHDVKSRRVPGGRSKPAASGSGSDVSSSFSSPRSPTRTKSSQHSSSNHSRRVESIFGVKKSPSPISPGSSSPSQPTHQPPSGHPRRSRPNRKEEVGSIGSDSNEELASSSSDSQITSSGHLSREKSSSSEATSLLNGPVGSTSSGPSLPRESLVQSPSVHSSASSSTESSGSSSHLSPGLSERCDSVAPALSLNHPEEDPPPEPVTPPGASLTPGTEPVSGGSYLDALSRAAGSVEPTSFDRGTSSKVESNSARESGYLSGLARGTPRATSLTSSYSTSRSTNPVSGDSYLEALSGPSGSVPGDTIKSPSFGPDGQSKPVAAGPAQGNNDLESWGSGSHTNMFRHSSSGLSKRRSSVAPDVGSTYPGEVLLSEPTETPPATSPTPENQPFSRGSYLDALSGPGDYSLEPAQHARGTISKQASNLARESGYSSQVAQGTPPATSLTPTYSTSQSTNPMSGGSYLDALSSLGASNTGNAIQSASLGPDGESKPVVSSPAHGSNDLESCGSGSKTKVFRQSSSGLSERSSSSAPALTSNHPEDVLPPNPPVTPPATSLTPHSEPVSRDSYLDALSGSGDDDSVEATPHGRGTISKHESHSARESGYLSGLAPGIPPATSLTPTYSTPRRTNAVSGSSYLEALSGPSGSVRVDATESSSKNVASNRERGYSSGLGTSSSFASQSYSAPGPVQRSGSPSLPTVPPVVSPVAAPVVSPPALGRPAGDSNPVGSYLDALADPGGRLYPSSNCPTDGSKPDASSPAPEKSYSSGLGTTPSSAGRRNGTPVPEQSSYSKPLVAPPALSFVTPPIVRRTAPPVTSTGSLAGSSITTKDTVGNSYLDALADRQGSFKPAPSGVKPVGTGLPPRTKYLSELGTNSPFASQPYSSPVSPQATNSDPYRVDPTVAPPTQADENAPPSPENRFCGQS